VFPKLGLFVESCYYCFTSPCVYKHFQCFDAADWLTESAFNLLKVLLQQITQFEFWVMWPSLEKLWKKCRYHKSNVLVVVAAAAAADLLD